jgi:hypothetical protein
VRVGSSWLFICRLGWFWLQPNVVRQWLEVLTWWRGGEWQLRRWIGVTFLRWFSGGCRILWFGMSSFVIAWFWSCRCGINVVGVWFSGYLTFWPLLNLLRFAVLFLSLYWFPNLLRFAGFLYLTDFYLVGVDYTVWTLEDCKLRLINLGFLSMGVHQLLTQGVAFWILMGQTLLIRVRELVYSDISTGWVDVFCGGLVAESVISENEIRSRPLLGDVYFGIFISVPLIYGTFVL